MRSTKGVPEWSRLAASAADVYESLAFLRASGSSRLALLYPRRLQAAESAPVGTAERFELIESGDLQIHAFEVEVHGISERHGLRESKRAGCQQRFTATSA